MAAAGSMPAALANRPTVPDEWAWAMRAYNDLSGSRATGTGSAGPIPISEIKAYCELMDISNHEDREDLVLIIREIDQGYLQVMARRAEQRAKAGKR